jgi:hypothetical protein
MHHRMARSRCVAGRSCWVIPNTTRLQGTTQCASSNFACAGIGRMFRSAAVNTQICVGNNSPQSCDRRPCADQTRLSSVLDFLTRCRPIVNHSSVGCRTFGTKLTSIDWHGEPKMIKTNAVRALDRLGISYKLREYEVDPDDLFAGTAAANTGIPPEQLFKTLRCRGDSQWNLSSGSRRRTLLFGPGSSGSDASIDRSSPVLRSSSKAPNRTRSKGRVFMGTAQ